MRRFSRWVLGIAIALIAVVRGVAAQPPGIVTGVVRDAASGQPVASAQVSVVGTNLGALTNDQGRYTIRGVPPGQQRIRAIRVGFSEAVTVATVGVSAGATADIQMRTSAVTLTPVVTTATGEQRRVEVANAVGNVKAAEITETQQVKSVGDLLTARTPGVQVLPGTMTGTGSRVRIRGTSSLSLSNEPIYVIDGIRLESSVNSTSIGVGGSTPGRVNDLNPDEIESIEVLRGPAAATLYGTDAASGVILITTKRGRAGATQWTGYVEGGLIGDRHDWPSSYTNYGKTTTGAITAQCFNFQRAAGVCTTSDSLVKFNPVGIDSLNPVQEGNRQQYGLQVRGGSDIVRYFASGEWEKEVGLLKSPSAGINALTANGDSYLAEWRRPNTMRRGSGRANLDITVSPKADISVSTNYIALAQRLPQSDNNALGWGPTLFGAGPRGYGFYDPAQSFQETVTQNVDRFIGQVGSNFRPTTWLSARGNFGADYTSRVDSDLCRFLTCPPLGTTREGAKSDNRSNFYQYTADVNAAASFQLTSAINSRTTVGAQFFRNLFDRNGSNGTQLPPGATQTGAGAVKNASEVTDDARTLGAFIEEQIGINDRLFLTAAMRTDRNSAFGQDFAAVYYPKVSASWVVSSEPFFPQFGWLSQLRVRSAYGAAGRQPGPIDALPYFSTIVNRTLSAEATGLIVDALGNRNLKPERSTEFEAGFDADFFSNRVGLEFTYYTKSSRDALINRVLAPSLGTNATTRLENLGEVQNSGFEGLLNLSLVQRRALRWDMSINASTNKNKLVDLGGVPPIIGATIRQIEGYPLNSYWERPILSYGDKNNDGLIGAGEVQLDTAFRFIGYSAPRHEVSWTNTFAFFNDRLQLQALVDYKGGHKLYNNTERFRCIDQSNCRGLADPSASLFEQARVYAGRVGDAQGRSLAGFMEDASFIRFRELSATFRVPDTFVRRSLGGRSLGLTLAARNLGFITDYSGQDPEANYGQNSVPQDFLTAPPASYLTLRINLGF